MLIRAAGPALAGAPFNRPGALPNPAITLFGPDSATVIAGTNDDWHAGGNADGIRAAASRLGAFSFAENSLDAALLTTLLPGAYTVQAEAGGQPPGIALIEVYDAEPSFTVSSSRLVNTSVRARVGTGANILIPGVVVSAGAPRNVLIRAVGPGLSGFGIEDFLAAPALALFSGAERRLANTRWNTAPNAAEIRAAASRIGAFGLAEGSADSALLVPLSPGAYTIQVSGENEASGVVLVEVYEVP